MTHCLHRQATRIAALLVVAAGMAGGTARAADLVFWTAQHEPDRLATIRYLARAFEAIHPDHRVVVEGFEENALLSAFEGAAAAGRLPDLIEADSDLLHVLAHRGHLDVDAARNLVREVGGDRFFRTALARMGVDGRPVALPMHGWVQTIWYRADWFDEAGLSPPDSWGPLMAAARHFHDPDEGRYGIVLGTADDAYARQTFIHLALSNGVRLLDEEGEVAFDAPETVQALAFYTELAALTPPGPDTVAARAHFLEGNAAMIVYSSFLLPAIASPGPPPGGPHAVADTSANRGRHGIVPLLAGKRAAGFGAVSGLAVVTGADSSAESFARFLFRPDAYISWLQMAPGGMLPVLDGIADSAPFHGDATEVYLRAGRDRTRALIQALNGIDGLGDPGSESARIANAMVASGVIERMVGRTLSGELTPEAAVRAAAGEVRQLQERLRALGSG